MGELSTTEKIIRDMYSDYSAMFRGKPDKTPTYVKLTNDDKDEVQRVFDLMRRSK